MLLLHLDELDLGQGVLVRLSIVDHVTYLHNSYTNYKI